MKTHPSEKLHPAQQMLENMLAADEAWRCPDCREINKNFLSACWNCGLSKPADPKQPQLEI